MNAPPRPKETPPEAVGAATEGKELQGEAVETLSVNVKSPRDGKPMEVRPGVSLRITRKGRIYRAGGVYSW